MPFQYLFNSMSTTMENRFKDLTIILVIIVFSSMFIIPAKAETVSYEKSINAYEKLIAIEPQENIKINTQTADIEDIDKIANLYYKKEDEKINATTRYLSFEHDKLPNLNGTWFLTKRTIKRLNPDIILKQPTTFAFCTARMPIENKDIVNKKILVNARGIDFFVFDPKFPNTKDIYHDPNQEKDIEYINFGFKGEVDAFDLTYAYTLKTNNHIEDNPTLARQLILNAKLEYKLLSNNVIIAKGWEKQESPECHGFVLDEVEVKLVRVGGEDGGDGRLPAKPLFEQPAYAADKSPEPGLQFDSAKDKSKIDATSDYHTKGKSVPGMW